MRATIRDIASNLNVSHTTVSRVLNRRDNARVSEETRARIENEALILGYRPNRAARVLVTGKTNLIGLGMGDFATYNVSVMHEVDVKLRERGYQMLVQRLPEPERMEELLQWPMDGLILLDFPGHVENLLKSGPINLPLVNIGTYSSEAVDHVALDLRVGAEQAMRHLVELGYRRIVYVASQWETRAGEPRFDAYAEEMRRANLKPEYLTLEGPTRTAACAGLNSFLTHSPFESGNPTQALFCLNDDIAIGCYRTLLDHGLRVPRDVALIGCDDIEDIRYLECRLSSIAYPIGAICETALNFLEARIENPLLNRQKAIIPAKFVSRESTREK